MKLYWKSSIKKQNWIQTYLPPLSCAASPRQPSLSSWTNPQISWKTWSLTTPHRLLFLNSFYFKVYQTHRTGVFSAGTTEDLTTDFISVPILRIWSEMNPLSLSSEITTCCNEIVQTTRIKIRTSPPHPPSCNRRLQKVPKSPCSIHWLTMSIWSCLEEL